MPFKKRTGMIDIRELQKRGVVRIPKEQINVSETAQDFLDLQSQNTQDQSERSGNTFPREQSERMTELDNKIYKLENRIELLEKKLDINQPSQESTGIIGW